METATLIYLLTNIIAILNGTNIELTPAQELRVVDMLNTLQAQQEIVVDSPRRLKTRSDERVIAIPEPSYKTAVEPVPEAVIDTYRYKCPYVNCFGISTP